MAETELVDVPLEERVIKACNVLGWNAPRPLQQEVLDPLLEGRDVVAVLKTSAGKSGIYQIPALARPGLVVVVSPLVALMADQVVRLRQHGINAHMLNSLCSAMDKRRAMDAVQSGNAKLLYMSPERLQGVTKAFFGQSKLQLIAIDEAHCISEWGHDFRPAYMRVGKSLARLGDVQKIALTATATSTVVDEIAEVLGIRFDAGAARIVKTPDRPNLMYGIVGKKVNIVRLVQRAGLPCLVYGSTRKSVEDAATELRRSGFNAAHYHAGMNKDDRKDVQDRFIAGDIEVVTATTAFGMGIDARIRSVVHLEMPTSLESYTQEVGRAGRSGEPAIAICRATVDTLKVAVSLAAMAWPTPGTIRRFWKDLQPLFRAIPGKWEGEGRLQQTNEEIANKLGYDPREVGSCLRILNDCGAIRRVPYQDRPVTVTLLSGASALKGRRQMQVVRRLREHADAKGEVQGSVAFFRNVIGLDRSYAKDLNLAHGIQFQWVERCQMIERMTEGDPELNEEQINRIRRRSLARIQSARAYLYAPGCRRDYLLRYFGDESGGAPSGRCCDRCPAPSAT
jgi:ATP-dependent DNA helicase RecQ